MLCPLQLSGPHGTSNFDHQTLICSTLNYTIAHVVGGWVRKSPNHGYVIYEWSPSLRPTRSSEANEPNGGRAVIACSLPFGHFGHTGLSDLLVHQNPKGGKKGHLQLLQVQENT